MLEPQPLEIDASVAGCLSRALRLEPFFPEFRAEHARKLFPRSGLFAFARDHVIVRQGDAGRDLFVVYSGRLGVHRELGSAAATLATMDAGAVIGEIALLSDVPRTATVTTLDESKVYRLSFLDIQYILVHNAELAAHLKALAAQRLGA